MNNHDHLLIEVDKAPLSKIMQGIQQVFTIKRMIEQDTSLNKDIKQYYAIKMNIF